MENSRLRKNINNEIEDEENIDINEYYEQRSDIDSDSDANDEEADNKVYAEKTYGYIPLDVARQAKINIYAFLYYKFENEDLRKKTKDNIVKLLNESFGNIINTGRIIEYNQVDEDDKISELGLILTKCLDSYDPYHADGKTVPFVPYFRTCANRAIGKINKKATKHNKFVIPGEEIETKPEGGPDEPPYEEGTDSDAYKMIQCLYSLCDAKNFKKFYKKNREGVDETRKPYFKMFLTGDVISLVKNSADDDFSKFVLPSQEKFATELDDDFIDFVYIRELIDHYFNSLRDTDLKTYSELGIKVSENSTKSLPNKMLDLPFQHNVYAKYANKTETHIHDMYYKKVYSDTGNVIEGYHYFFNKFMGIDEER